MINIKIGAKYLIITTNNFSLLNLDDSFTSSIRICGLMIYPINTQVKNATIFAQSGKKRWSIAPVREEFINNV